MALDNVIAPLPTGQVRQRRAVAIQSGTTAENNAFTGVEGQLTWDREAKTLRVHDEVTAGGNVVATTASS